MTYQELVSALCKPGKEILASLLPSDCHAWHMSSCLCGESGELFDAVKKVVIYRKEIDLPNIIEELGDIEFYLEGLRQAFGLTREEVLKANIEKLQKRYGSTYSDQAAQERKDKQNG